MFFNKKYFISLWYNVRTRFNNSANYIQFQAHRFCFFFSLLMNYDKQENPSSRKLIENRLTFREEFLFFSVTWFRVLGNEFIHRIKKIKFQLSLHDIYFLKNICFWLASFQFPGSSLYKYFYFQSTLLQVYVYILNNHLEILVNFLFFLFDLMSGVRWDFLKKYNSNCVIISVSDWCIDMFSLV